MGALPSDEEIFRKVADIIVEALRIDPEAVSMKSNILKDFDAESIDLVDIRFRIEGVFGFKVDQEEFIRGLGEGLSPSAIGDNVTVGRVVMYIRKRLVEKVN